MGSVREGAEAMADAETELGVANEEGVPAGVPAPANPLPNQGPGTPPGPPPVTPPHGEGSDVPGLPSADAVEESKTKKAKKARLEETQETVAQLTGLVQSTLTSMQELTETVKLSNQQQKELQAEIDQLAKQLNSDSVSVKVIYNSLNEFQRSLTNGVWQLSGGKRDSQTSCKEVLLHMEDFLRQCSLRLLESKNEVRAQHASTITSIKEVTSAVRALEQAIRAGTEQAAAPAAPAAPGTAAVPAAPAVEVNPGGPAAPKAAPMVAAAMTAPSTATATMGAPATAAMPAVGTVNRPADPGVMPGYGSASAPAVMNPPPPAGGPVFQPPVATAPAPRPGRIRVALRDGSVAARAVSPHGRLPTGVTPEWSNEYGLGTVTCGGYVYRVLPDSFLDGSVALN